MNLLAGSVELDEPAATCRRWTFEAISRRQILETICMTCWKNLLDDSELDERRLKDPVEKSTKPMLKGRQDKEMRRKRDTPTG